MNHLNLKESYQKEENNDHKLIKAEIQIIVQSHLQQTFKG